MIHYEYPNVLYCVNCDKDVTCKIEERTEMLVKNDKPCPVSYNVAVCPDCGNLLCERDIDYAILREAEKDGFLKGGEKDG